MSLAFMQTGLHNFLLTAASAVSLPSELLNSINTVWTLIAAFLVFFMQAGFAMLESGSTRSKIS